MISLSLWFALGCTTIDQEGLKRIKTVAIIGFSGTIKEEGSHLEQFAKALADQSFGPKFYRMTQNQLKSSMGWSMVSLDKIKKVPFYQKQNKQKVNKAINAIERWHKRIIIPGILMDTMAAPYMSEKKRRSALAKELNADAFMTIRFEISPENLTSGKSDQLMGLIKNNPVKVRILECSLSLELVEAKTGQTIWKQPGILGKAGATPNVQIFGISFPNLKQRAVASAFSKALTSHIREAKVGD